MERLSRIESSTKNDTQAQTTSLWNGRSMTVAERAKFSNELAEHIANAIYTNTMLPTLDDLKKSTDR